MKLEKKFSVFPWYKDVHSQMQKTFTFGNEKAVEDALESFVELVKAELDAIFKECDTDRAEALLNVVKDCLLCLHFQNILHKDGFQDSKYLYLRLLSSFLDLCIVLSAHLSSSRMDLAFQHLCLCSKSDVVIMYDVLLQCQLLKKVYGELCCPILRQVLSSSVNRDLEPEQFMKFILLARLWKVFSKKTEKEHVKALVAKAKVPRDFLAFISSFPVPEISSVSTTTKRKKIAVYFLCNKFQKNVLMVVKQILCNQTLASANRVTTSMPVTFPPDIDGNESLFCIDRGSVNENKSDYRLTESQDHLLEDSDANEYQHLPSSSRTLNSLHEEFKAVEEHIDVPDEKKLVLDDTQNIDMDVDHEDNYPDDAETKSGESNNGSFNLRFSSTPDRLQCSTEFLKSPIDLTGDKSSSEEPYEFSILLETKNKSCKNESSKRKYTDVNDLKSFILPSQNEMDRKSLGSSKKADEEITGKQKSDKNSKKESQMNDDSFLNISSALQMNDTSVGDLMNISSINASLRSLSSEKLSEEAFKRCETWVQEFKPPTDSEKGMYGCSSSSENYCLNGCDGTIKMTTLLPSSPKALTKLGKNSTVSTLPKIQGCNGTLIIKEVDKQQPIKLKPLQEASFAFKECDLLPEILMDTDSESKNSSDLCIEEQDLVSKNAALNLRNPSELLGISDGVNSNSIAADSKEEEVVEDGDILAIDEEDDDEGDCRYVKCLYPGQNLPSKEMMPHTRNKRLNSKNMSQTKKIEDGSQKSCISLAGPTISSKLNEIKKTSPHKPDGRNDSPSRKRVKLEERVSEITRAKAMSLSSARELRSAVSKQTESMNLPLRKALRQTPVKAINATIVNTRKSQRKSPTPSKVMQSKDNQSDSEFHSPDTSDCENSEFGSPSLLTTGKKTLTCNTKLGDGSRKLRVNLAKNNAAFNFENKDIQGSDKSLSKLRDVGVTPSKKKTSRSKSNASSQGSPMKGLLSCKKIPSSSSSKDKSNCEFSPPTLRSPAKKYNLRIRTSKTPWKKMVP